MHDATTPPHAPPGPDTGPSDVSSPGPLEHHFTVTSVERAGTYLWRVSMVGPDRHLYSILIPSGIITMETVRLSATAAAQLWQYKIGATPIAEAR